MFARMRTEEFQKHDKLKKADQLFVSNVEFVFKWKSVFNKWEWVHTAYAKMQSFSAKSQKRLSNKSSNNLTFSVQFLKLPVWAAHSIYSFKYGI